MTRTTLWDILHAPIKSEGKKRKKQIHKVHRELTGNIYWEQRQHILQKRRHI